MNRDLIEQKVERILRATALSGSDREISLADPFGELGLGLDSLALVQFVTALEKEFQVPMPDDLWTARGQLTLNHFVDILAGSRSKLAKVESGPTISSVSTATEAPSQPRNDSLGTDLGKSNRNDSAFVSTLFETLKYFYLSHLYYIVQCELSEQILPAYSPALKLSLRAASLDDAPALTAFWKANRNITFNKRRMTIELFEKLLASGHICYVAWLDDEIVGSDWVWDKGFYCWSTGLRLDWPKDTSYGGELYEHKRYRGKGIGLALLAFSLSELKKKGYARQVCWVEAGNIPMLSASIQLFNFEIIGSIRQWGIVPPLAFSTWETDRRAGRGGTLVL